MPISKLLRKIDVRNPVAFDIWREKCRQSIGYRYGIKYKQEFTEKTKPKPLSSVTNVQDGWQRELKERLVAYNAGMHFLRSIRNIPENNTIEKRKARRYWADDLRLFFKPVYDFLDWIVKLSK